MQLDESLIPSDFLDNLELEEFPPAYQPYDEMFRYQSDLYHEALPLIKKNDQRFILKCKNNLPHKIHNFCLRFSIFCL